MIRFVVCFRVGYGDDRGKLGWDERGGMLIWWGLYRVGTIEGTIEIRWVG